MTADHGRFPKSTAIGRRHQLPLFLVHFAQGRSTDEQMPSTLLDYLHTSIRRR